MATFAAYNHLPSLPEEQADMAKRLVDGIRQANDTAGMSESSGLDPWEDRLAKNVFVGPAHPPTDLPPDTQSRGSSLASRFRQADR
mmetsp:Transcript_29221/g.84493  ORF Transcript_29221/g.84493 Transcript_29221/m.84493 type:complete len:86 (-) Transcript_29221:2623-2880(-)